MMIQINKTKCNKCRRCEKACPFDAVSFSDYPEFNESCVLCGACEKICPTKAISIKRTSGKDTSESSGILVFAETKQDMILDISFELLTKANELSEKLDEKVMAVVLVSENTDVSILAEYGASKIYVFADTDFKKYNSEAYAKVISDLVKEINPSIFLIGATHIGRELAPRISSRLKTGLTADCTCLDINENGLLMQTRPAFGGNIMATIYTPNSRPQMATVRQKVIKKKKNPKNPEIIFKQSNYENKDIKIIKETIFSKTTDITDAEVIVAGGRGMGKKQGFDLLEKLADTLGARVGASRAAVESGWVDYPMQVGLSGKTVRPKIYIACGISGAVQHISGMENSDYIIAINIDENAPIFKIADLGIVGDVYEVLPRLISKLKSKV
ncbi:electron transfer flavoprotein subunit alpha [Candidatus Woesearchaeota archaeon]|nr:electron transfer flavoprotein subunit alpha [Candidatus Woesearchaeota archaeon]